MLIITLIIPNKPLVTTVRQVPPFLLLPGKALTPPPTRPLPLLQEGEGPIPPQVIAQLSSQEEGNSQAVVHLPSQEGSSQLQAIAPPRQHSLGKAAANPHTPFPLGKVGTPLPNRSTQQH